MKYIFTLCSLFLLSSINAQIVYVDNYDGVYPNINSSITYYLDINGDTLNDISLKFLSNSGYCPSNDTVLDNIYISFEGLTNSIGINKVNSNANTNNMAIDCTNDSINNQSLFSTIGRINWSCYTVGFGNHKLGFKLILPNPLNGALGNKYGYIDYSFTSDGDIIVHGWYYSDMFSQPIIANSLPDYPANSSCINYDTVNVYDTLQVYDTITTMVYDTNYVTIYDTITSYQTVYDTLTTYITEFDTVLVSVTDTLIINTALSLPPPNNENTILIYPNPAHDHLTIDHGNYALMNGYSIKISNIAGQVLYWNQINQQQTYLDISNWPQDSMYFITLIDSQGNTLTTRKLVFQ